MTLLEIKDLVKKYGDFTAVDHFNLKIQEGEILGLLGPNGSGKTTTIHCLLSLLNYEYGSITLFDKPMTPTAYESKRNIGIVPQDVAVFEELSVYENIDYFCGLYILDRKKRKELVEEAIDFVGLQEFKKHRPKALSGGLLRRLNIACGIAHQPRFIIFDEPTVAVDPQSRNRILEGIKALNAKGSTILYTSHYMEEIEQICSRIVIMDKGKEIAQGTKESLKALSQGGETIVFELYELQEQHRQIIEALPYVKEIVMEDGQLRIRCVQAKENFPHLIKCFTDEGIEYMSVKHEMPTLNDVFLEITGKDLRD